MSLHNDNHIEKLFSEQRAADQKRAPSFARSWQVAAARDWSPPLAAWCLPALVSTAMLAVVFTFWQTRSAPDVTFVQAPQPVTVVASISDWTAPTDVLLEMPAFSDELLPVADSQP